MILILIQGEKPADLANTLVSALNLRLQQFELRFLSIYRSPRMGNDEQGIFLLLFVYHTKAMFLGIR